MPDVTITVTQREIDMITLLAARASKTPRQFVEDHIRQMAIGNARGYYLNQIRNMSLADLETLLGPIE